MKILQKLLKNRLLMAVSVFLVVVTASVIHTGKVSAQTYSYPVNGAQYISVSRAGNGIHLTADSAVVKVKFSGDTPYGKVWIGDGAFHSGVDAGSPPGVPRGGDTTYQICGSDVTGAKNQTSCSPELDASSFGALQQINIQDVGGASFAYTISMPRASDNFRHAYVIARFYSVGLNGFRVGATGYSNPQMTAETGYTRVGFAATQGQGYNMSLVRLPLNSGIRDNYTLQFKAPCSTTTGFVVRWYDADRPPSTTPRDTNIRWVLRNDTTGQEIQSVTMAFLSRTDENNYLGGDEAPREAPIPNSSLLRVQAGDSYSWTWYDVLGTNGVQMQLPFAEPDYDVGCPPPFVQDGWLETATCNLIAGWAYDERVGTGALGVLLQFDGRYNYQVLANRFQPGLPANWGSNHRFEFNPASVSIPGLNLYDGVSHTVDAIAYGANSSTWRLKLSPQTIPSCGQSFTLDATGNTLLGIDKESPNKVQFGGTVGVAGPPLVKDVDITAKWVTAGPGATEAQVISSGVTFGTTPDPITRNVSSGGLQLDPGLVGYTQNSLPPNLTAGKQVCIVITLTPGSGSVDRVGTITSKGPARTRAICDVVANKPYVSFYGNDVKVGGGFEASPCVASAQIDTFLNSSGRGSNTQLAAFALGTIKGLATASLRTSTPSPPSGLSFVNFGSYTPPCSTHNYFSDAPTAVSVGSTVDLSTMPTLPNGKARGPAGTTIDKASTSTVTIPNGKHVYLYVSGNVIIKDNIQFDQGWSDRSQIPSVYIVASGNIYIDKDVTRLDGVYVAQGSGTIYTCANGSTPYTTVQIYDNCGKQLVVNGSFISQSVKLLRTFGSLRNASGDTPYGGAGNTCSSATLQPAAKVCAAEVFNFSPSLYLAEAPEPVTGTNTSDREYQYVTNLPPIL